MQEVKKLKCNGVWKIVSTLIFCIKLHKVDKDNFNSSCSFKTFKVVYERKDSVVEKTPTGEDEVLFVVTGENWK